MSTHPNFDSHEFCSNCIGHACNYEIRCDHCKSWPDIKMMKYVQHLASLTHQSKINKGRDRPIELVEPGEAGLDNSSLGEKSSNNSMGSLEIQDANENLRLKERREEYFEDRISELEGKMNDNFGKMISSITAIIDARFKQSSCSSSQITSRTLGLGLSSDQREDSSPNSKSRRMLIENENQEPRPGCSSSPSPILSRDEKLIKNTLKILGIPSSQVNLKANQSSHSGRIGSSKISQTSPSKRIGSLSLGQNKSPTSRLVNRKEIPPKRDEVPTQDDYDNDYEYDEEDYDYDEEEDIDDDYENEFEVNEEYKGKEEESNRPPKEDNTFHRMLDLVGEYFPQTKAQVPKSPPRQCLHEDRFEEKKKQTETVRLRLYDRVSRVRSDVARRLSFLMRKGKKPISLIPPAKRSFRVAEDDSFNAAPTLNEEFESLLGNSFPSNKSIFFPMDEIIRLEDILKSIQENQSFALWVISTLFCLLDDAGFTNSDPEMIKKMSNSLSFAMVNQCMMTHRVSSYLVARRREHYLNSLSSSIKISQKRKLRSSSPFLEELFDPQILENIISQFKGDTATSAQVALSRMNVRRPPQYKRRRIISGPSYTPQAGPSQLSGLGSSGSDRSSSVSGASDFEYSSPSKSRGKLNGRGRGRGRALSRFGGSRRNFRFPLARRQ